MSRQTNISVMGLYNWDNTIFDMMLIPENLDRTVVIENILAETAELEVIYPNPYVFKSLVGVWSHKQIDIWNRLYNTTQYEYNPIENYNRYETGSEDGENVTAHSGTDSNTETIAHTGTNSNTKANTLGGNDSIVSTSTDGGNDRIVSTSTDGGSETENITNHFETEGTDTTTGTKEVKEYVAGFDSVPSANDDGLVLKGKTNETGTSTTTTSREDDATAGKTTTFGKTNNTTEQTTYGKTNNTTEQTTYGKTENETDTLTFNDTITKNGGITHGESVTSTKEGQFENHAHGNIGVTTTQKLIREQREVEKFNLYDIIIEEFKERFCIMVY